MPGYTLYNYQLYPIYFGHTRPPVFPPFLGCRAKFLLGCPGGYAQEAEDENDQEDGSGHLGSHDIIGMNH